MSIMVRRIATAGIGSFDGSLMIESDRVTAERNMVMKATAGVLPAMM
jgi:hypothetical protein